MTEKTGGTILITGASRGIGRATSDKLTRGGHDVIGLARNPPEDEFPGEFHAVDLADRAATAAMLDEITAGREIMGLINNVGVNRVQPLEEVDLDAFDEVIDINLRTAIQCAQAVLPGMKARGYGRIVNISSRAALGREGRTGYSAAKAGVIG